MSKKMLERKVRDKIADKLSHYLADLMVLYVKTLNFHWNMVGPEFFMYHRLLEEQYKEMAEALDEIAERIRQLGEKAPGSMHEMMQLACLEESKASLNWRVMIEELEQNHEELVEHLHEVIKYIDEVYDQGTSDLLATQIRAHAKAAWLLRSNLETKS